MSLYDALSKVTKHLSDESLRALLKDLNDSRYLRQLTLEETDQCKALLTVEMSDRGTLPDDTKYLDDLKDALLGTLGNLASDIVHSVGIGKTEDGRGALYVYVKKKPSFAFPKEFCGVPLRVEVVGEVSVG